VGISKAQSTILEKARVLGSATRGIALTDDQCKGLIAVIARDLGVADRFSAVTATGDDYYATQPPEALAITGGGSLYDWYETLLEAVEDGETYFACLAELHKRRLKFRRILSTQPLPTKDQVGPRGLLEYGVIPTRELVALLSWRKWLYDIDNRVAQETGYLFEPIITGAIGGAPAPARTSPIKRRSDPSKGRQADCIRQRDAYEFKMRVTIAASGQGRWQEELDFPEDCRESGFTPHLIVFDPTPAPKLEQLAKAFTDAGGEAHIGEGAWRHLEAAAGVTMATFLERYLRAPLEEMLAQPWGAVPDLLLHMEAEKVVLALGETLYEMRRGTPDQSLVVPRSDVPDDAPQGLPGI
jgi:hypothetical protein